MNHTKAFIIAATKSGAGKTTLTLGILSWLVQKGFKVQPFKCGPDFIDPTLHEKITGYSSYNLDLKMMGPQVCRQTYIEKSMSADISVIEGVMGLFDGGEASTAELAKALGIPIFLIIDARSSAQSCAAVLKGFEIYDPDVVLGGVIFNKIGSARHQMLIEEGCSNNCNTPIVGFMPRAVDFMIPERHLGLHMGEEEPFSATNVRKLTGAIDEHLDLDQILARSETKVQRGVTAPPKKISTQPKKKKRIAVARDRAFCFYYQQNIEMLEENGFEIVPFSPLEDSEPPQDITMIYLGGGYPELHCAQLSSNRAMGEAIRNWHAKSMPIYAECGGFMYLCESLDDMEEKTFPMVGIFPFQVIMNKRLRNLGYHCASILEDCLLGDKGTIVHGHEFHYSNIKQENPGKKALLRRLYSLDNSSHEGYIAGSALGSYIHLHFGRTPHLLRSMNQFLENTGQ